MKLVSSFVSFLKSTKFDIGAFFVSFLSIVIIRTFFEYIFESSHFIAPMDNFYDNVVEYFHIVLSWLSVFLSVVYILNLFDKDKISNTIKIVLSLFAVIIIVPILDYFVFESGKILYETNFDNFWFKYIHLFDFTMYDMPSITNGVRVEIVLVSIFSFIYIYVIRKSIVVALSATIMVYSAIFFYGYLPACVNFVFETSYNIIVQNGVLVSKSIIHLNFYTYLPILSVLFVLYLIKLDSRYRYMIVDSFRFERLSIYIGLFLFGFFISAKNGLVESEVFNLYDLLKLYSAILSISCSFAYATMLNNIYDVHIDRLSNQNRATIKCQIPIKTYSDIKNIFLFFSIVFGIGVNSEFVFIVIATVALSYVYSAYPLRLKRFIGLSSVVLSTIAVMVFLEGVCVVEGNVAFIQSNSVYLFGIFLFFLIASNLKDIKDTHSDSLYGITTLSTLIGVDRAFVFLKIFVFFGFLFVVKIFDFDWVFSILFCMLYGVGAFFIKDSEKLLIFIQVIAGLIYVASFFR